MWKFIRKWGFRAFATLACLLLCAVGCMSVAHVDQAATDRCTGLAPNDITGAIDWPSRATPRLPKIEVSEGEGPTDCGPFGQCQVLHQSHAIDSDSYLLVTGFADPRVKVSGAWNYSTDGPNVSSYRIQLENQTFVYCWCDLPRVKLRSVRCTI